MKVTLDSTSTYNGNVYKSTKKWEDLKNDEIAYIGEYDFEPFDGVSTDEEEIIEACYPCTKADMIECVKEHFKALGIFDETPQEFAETIAKDIFCIADWACFGTYLEEDVEGLEGLILKYGGKL